jgi:hypothetical protein
MEWNTARLKFAVLSGKAPEGLDAKAPEEAQPGSFLAGATFGDLCRLGLALTWPVALVVLLAMAALIALLAKH